MAKLVFGLNQSLDGYVDHQEFAPGPALFHHFIEQVRGLTGSVYGRRMYEVMRVWDEDRPEWSAEFRDFARGGMAEPTEVGRVTLAEVSWSQCHACRGRHRGGDTGAEGPARWRDSSWRTSWHEASPTLVLLMSIDSTSAPSCSVAASHSSPAPGRRCALWPAI